MALLPTTRSQEIIDPAKYGKTPITIIGVGATGSHLAMTLMELGFTHITFYDPDTVAAHNINNQAYEMKDVDTPKVEALKRLIQEKTGAPVPSTLQFLQESVHDTTKLNGVVFLLTDTMASRHEISECFEDFAVMQVIETRMASSYGNILMFDPKTELEAWRSTLSDDENTEVSACGASITVSPTAKILANLAAWKLINWITDPAAADPRLDFYLKPGSFNFRKLTD